MSTFSNATVVSGVLVSAPDREKIGEYETPVLKAELEAAAPAVGWKVVLDLSEVRLLASAGLGMVVSLSKKCRENGGKLVLCAMDPMLKSVFEMTKLDRILTIVETRDLAMKAVA